MFTCEVTITSPIDGSQETNNCVPDFYVYDTWAMMREDPFWKDQTSLYNYWEEYWQDACEQKTVEADCNDFIMFDEQCTVVVAYDTCVIDQFTCEYNGFDATSGEPVTEDCSADFFDSDFWIQMAEEPFWEQGHDDFYEYFQDYHSTECEGADCDTDDDDDDDDECTEIQLKEQCNHFDAEAPEDCRTELFYNSCDIGDFTCYTFVEGETVECRKYYTELYHWNTHTGPILAEEGETSEWYPVYEYWQSIHSDNERCFAQCQEFPCDSDDECMHYEVCYDCAQELIHCMEIGLDESGQDCTEYFELPADCEEAETCSEVECTEMSGTAECMLHECYNECTNVDYCFVNFLDETNEQQEMSCEDFYKWIED